MYRQTSKCRKFTRVSVEFYTETDSRTIAENLENGANLTSSCKDAIHPHKVTLVETTRVVLATMPESELVGLKVSRGR